MILSLISFISSGTATRIIEKIFISRSVIHKKTIYLFVFGKNQDVYSSFLEFLFDTLSPQLHT